MKYLYKYEVKESFKECSREHALKYKTFTPSVRNGFFLAGETVDIKTFGVRLLFQIITMGKVKIFYAADEDGGIVHTSYVIPKCCKFPFMDKGDYEIGPCFTYPQHRGKGVYPAMLRCIQSDSIGVDNTKFYMIVDEENAASIKGIEKAGFVRFGTVKVTRVTKRYMLEKTF